MNHYKKRKIVPGPLLPLPSSIIPFVEPYLPPDLSCPSHDDLNVFHSRSLTSSPSNFMPFVTLTYTQSLDSRVTRESDSGKTAISHVETKTMTHYLRSKHDAILVSINTVLLGDPSFTCHFSGSQQDEEKFPTSPTIPASESKRQRLVRPVIIDPEFKFLDIYSTLKMFCDYKSQNGLSPIIVISELTLKKNEKQYKNWCTENDITLVALASTADYKMSWTDIFKSLKHLNINSVVVEGGATINDLLKTRVQETNEFVVSTLIVTIAPTYLGKKGLTVSPPSGIKLADVAWWTGKQDSVLCARLNELH